MISDDIAEEQRPRRWYICAGLRKVVLGSLTLYVLCTLGPGLIDYLTIRMKSPVHLALIVGTGLATADVGSLMLILGGLAHLRKALMMKAAQAVKVLDQPPAYAKEQQ